MIMENEKIFIYLINYKEPRNAEIKINIYKMEVM